MNVWIVLLFAGLMIGLIFCSQFIVKDKSLKLIMRVVAAILPSAFAYYGFNYYFGSDTYYWLILTVGAYGIPMLAYAIYSFVNGEDNTG